MSKKLDRKIAALETELRQAKTRAQLLNNRKRALAIKTSRALNTKRRILLGALIEREMKNDDAKKAEILEKLDSYLTKPMDRQAFGLEPLPAPESINISI
ncbi:MAG: mobilization protein [Sterolibacterium sp.]